jgi:hypothetical protein
MREKLPEVLDHEQVGYDVNLESFLDMTPDELFGGFLWK